MTRPAPEDPIDLGPGVHRLVTGLAADPATPTKVLISGGVGTGKTTVLTAARTALRAAGRPVLTRPPRSGDLPDAAIVIDDADLLADSELRLLIDHVADPGSTVLVAAAPLTHRDELRALAVALERENPVVTLGPLDRSELQRIADALDVALSPECERELMLATAGLPFLMRPAVAAAGAGDVNAIRAAAGYALIERLRRIDEPVRDALLVTSLSRELGPDDVAAALRIPAETALSVVDHARASGLIEPAHSPTFLRSVHDGVAQLAGAARHHDIEVSLLCSQLEMATLSTDLALQLAEHGLRDDRLATALTELADGLHGHAATAARVYRAAADAGTAVVSTHLADALALTGDCATAARLADELLASEDTAERAAAVRIAASIAAHDGSMAQAADLFRWLGPYPDAVVSAAATVTTLAAGDLAAAKTALSADPIGPPTSTARTARALAEGVLLSLGKPFPVAVARLSQSIAADQQSPGVIPDTPAALVTLAALHGGDPVRARSVIGRAVRTGRPDEIFVTYRHRLLSGWVRMQDGHLSAAAADVAAVGGAELHRRDALWAAALKTAIARRTGDAGAMQQHWYAAMEVLAEVAVDLFTLLPLGELWVAAARLRQLDRLEHTLSEAFALLDSLGNPVLWSVPLRWAGVHAGILANSPDAVAPHGQALTAAGRDANAPSAFAKALAGAGRTWLRVLANQVDTAEVTAAARSLSQFGLTWDAARLAGQAALQTPDTRVSQAMLQLARDLKQTIAGADIAAETAPSESSEPSAPRAVARHRTASHPASATLSDREREVAELLLLGMPYRDIGAQLFISAKTVEHHVARIRRRLGAESRSEMLSMLRAMLTPQH